MKTSKELYLVGVFSIVMTKMLNNLKRKFGLCPSVKTFAYNSGFWPEPCYFWLKVYIYSLCPSSHPLFYPPPCYIRAYHLAAAPVNIPACTTQRLILVVRLFICMICAVSWMIWDLGLTYIHNVFILKEQILTFEKALLLKTICSFA